MTLRFTPHYSPADHVEVALSAVCLTLSFFRDGILDEMPLPERPHFGQVTLTALRDELEATHLLGGKLPLTRLELEDLALTLKYVRDLLAQGLRVQGMPDLLAALTLPRVEAALRHALDLLDRGAALEA